MSGIFISYKTEERKIAQQIRASLALATKCNVWWDQDLQTGGIWSSELDHALSNADCVIVIWSKLSVKSPWVQQEAAIAKSFKKIVPLRIDDCDIPAPYKLIQTANLINWNGQETDSEFQKLVYGVKSCVKTAKRQRLHSNRLLITLSLLIIFVFGIFLGFFFKNFTQNIASSSNGSLNFNEYLLEIRTRYNLERKPDFFQYGELSEFKKKPLLLNLPGGSCWTYLAVVPPGNECSLNYYADGPGAKEIKFSESGSPFMKIGTICTAERKDAEAELILEIEMDKGSGQFALEVFANSQRSFDVIPEPVETPIKASKKTPVETLTETTTTTLSKEPNNIWSYTTLMGTPHSGLNTACIYKDKIYVIGGRESSGCKYQDHKEHFTDKLEVFDPKIKKWHYLKDCPFRAEVEYFCSDDSGNLIVFFSNTDCDTDPTGKIFTYSINTDSWMQLDDMKYKYGNTAVTKYKDYVYFFTGFEEFKWGKLKLTNHCFKYNIKTQEFHDIANIPTARISASAILNENKIYVIGGMYTGREGVNTYLSSGTVEVYDIYTDEWSNIDNLPEKGYYFAAVNYKNNLFIFTENIVYNYYQNSWNKFADISFNSYRSCAIAFKNDIYIIGGNEGKRQVIIFNPNL